MIRRERELVAFTVWIFGVRRRESTVTVKAVVTWESPFRVMVILAFPARFGVRIPLEDTLHTEGLALAKVRADGEICTWEKPLSIKNSTSFLSLRPSFILPVA